MEKNNNLESKIITLNFKQKNYQFSTELIKPVNTFYSEVCAYLQINPNKFNLYYNNQKLTLNSSNDIILSNIIGSNNEPFFKITQKKTKTPLKINLRYDSINSNPINPSTSRKNNLPNFLTISNNIKNKGIVNKRYKDESHYDKNNGNGNVGVVISQIQSVQDIANILENFNNKQNSKDLNLKTNNNFSKKEGILTVLGNNSVRIDFQTEMVLNEFISYISFMKYENSYFKNINIKKDNASIARNIRNVSLSQKNMHSYLHNFNKKYNYNNVYSPQNYNKNVKININDVIKALKQNELNHDCYHGLSLKRDGEDEIITDYYKQQSFLRNSSPYISENEKRILEDKENKKHFLDKHKQFVTSVGKYSMKPNFIPNYVGMTPSENPKTHEFRNVDKKKWITNKGFNV